MGFRNSDWKDQSGTLWGLGNINNNVDKDNKYYNFERDTKNEEKLYYYINAFIKPKVAKTIRLFDGSENVTIPYGKIEFQTRKEWELQIRNR